MPDKKPNITRRESFVEKLIRRALETVGGSVDRLFGRGRKPNALPQTADLGERLRKVIDERAQINQSGRKLAPHLIRLKYAWGQSSDEFLAALKKLENELLIAAIDHVNDHRYATLAPIKISSKADILTQGFAMSLGFDEEDLQNSEAVAIPVEIYAKLLPAEFQPQTAVKPNEIVIEAASVLPNGTERKKNLVAIAGEKANFIVGRIKECDLYLDDASVSKHHASLVFHHDGTLKVADVGSTNGTFLDGERIAYGKAYEIARATAVSFGDVKVRFNWEMPQPEVAAEPPIAENVDGAIRVGVASMKRTPADDNEKPQTAPESAIGDDDDDDKTYVDPEFYDSEKTFVDAELIEESQTFTNSQPSGAPKTFVDESLQEDFGTVLNQKSAAKSSAAHQTFAEESDDDSPRTFFDAELSQALDSFVADIEKDQPATVVGAAISSDEQTFVEREAQNPVSIQSVEKPITLSDRDADVLRLAIVEKGANDFSQSLPGLSDNKPESAARNSKSGESSADSQNG